ncbi:hypothetical protein M2454_000115 [Aequitasia blattaphilus]|uniref:KAP family NTPase n=1 Tax=Aequitasia blattaphilus TaxID=2949332 RepID=A0ABT1E4Y5_9FIRM|nr:KAP family NTPase [Aequitasia blattaphilus]MCP1100902.1 KAP family NTPase [Aequitasia blattaphilus]MCR8613542.1 KAP family NTPase [Aequitasia blattaphilus]
MATVDELVYFCQEENVFGALMFTGKWGCGKTYLIENDLAKALGNEYIILRISLFGESSIDSIHQKVQKAYFQEVMLNMGGNIEEFAKAFPHVSSEKAAQLGDHVEKVTETISDLSEKIGKSKFGKVVQFASGMAKKVPGFDKILALNPSDCMPVEESIAGRHVILVFDDLERSNLDEIDVLGCINEYSENKHIKTIIVANEEKIIAKNQESHEDGEEGFSGTERKSGKIKYSEIKEKIVTRTLKNIPDYKKIIENLAMSYQTKKYEYKDFLSNHIVDLINVFICGNIENIRSVKCAMQDFQRVFVELKEKGIDEELPAYFQTFVSYTLLAKEGKISKSDRYGYIFCDADVEKEYPGYYVRRYMLTSIREWIMMGEWNEKNISDDINKMIEVKRKATPEELVRNMRLIDLEEDVIREGFPEVLQNAYKGQLLVDEYIDLIGNILLARTIAYELPEVPDMKKLDEGVDICLETICNSDEPDTRVRRMISPNDVNSLTKEEGLIYEKICRFREEEVQMFAINKKKYLTALKSENISDLYECENKRFNIFDEEVCQAVMECYKKLQNSDRVSFIGVFQKIWESKIGSQDFLIAKSMPNFEKLKNELTTNRTNELQAEYGLKAALTQNFINDVTKIIEAIKKRLADMTKKVNEDEET